VDEKNRRDDERGGPRELIPPALKASGVLSILFFADLVGKPGRQALSQALRGLKERFSADLVIANVENSAGGFGVTPEMSRKIFAYGVAVQTSGNHIWDRLDIVRYIDNEPRLLRPHNFPAGTPGSGLYVGDFAGTPFAVLNLMGRTYMKAIDCPFQAAAYMLERIPKDVKVIFVDFHAEATSEKQALKYYLDGRVSAVLGTHTHVQTADAHVTRNGTAYITDVGMTGPHESILGMHVREALDRFLNSMPHRMSCADQDVRLCGALVRIDAATGRALSIEPFQEPYTPVGGAEDDD